MVNLILYNKWSSFSIPFYLVQCPTQIKLQLQPDYVILCAITVINSTLLWHIVTLKFMWLILQYYSLTHTGFLSNNIINSSRLKSSNTLLSACLCDTSPWLEMLLKVLRLSLINQCHNCLQGWKYEKIHDKYLIPLQRSKCWTQISIKVQYRAENWLKKDILPFLFLIR